MKVLQFVACIEIPNKYGDETLNGLIELHAALEDTILKRRNGLLGDDPDMIDSSDLNLLYRNMEEVCMIERAAFIHAKVKSLGMSRDKAKKEKTKK